MCNASRERCRRSATISRNRSAVDALARLVNMSVSSFHQHFKAVTSMTPVQYQKVLRLQEARRLMLSQVNDVRSAAREVGYVSPSQFSREYARFFGNAPMKDIARLREDGFTAERALDARYGSSPFPRPCRGVVLGALAAGLTAFARQSAAPLSSLVLPAGFQADVFAENVENARSMALGPQGTVFVGSQTAGKVHAVVDRNGDHKADRVVVIASGLDQPNGVAMRNGALYVATASRLLRFDDIEKHLDAPPAPVTSATTCRTRRPATRGSSSRSARTTCCTCRSARRATSACRPPMVSAILRMKPDGSAWRSFAEGVRNSVGFDWHPVTRELWFTDNGRDMLGDDVPGDELNVAPKPGLHFGFPFCHQGDVADPEFGAQRACSTTEPPAQKLGAHVAAIGFTFYTGNMFPASYRNAAIIAQHGSWNRSMPSGYRVMVARTEGRRVTSYEPLVDGFLPAPARRADAVRARRPPAGRPTCCRCPTARS